MSSKQENSGEEAQRTSQSDHVPTREVVVKATLKQLEKIKHAEQDGGQQSFTRFVSDMYRIYCILCFSGLKEFAPVNS